MTTNVYDSNKKFIATDSRWSVTWGRYVVYVDDAQYNKIERYKHLAFMFAGKGFRIDEWKQWLRSNPKDLSGMPPRDLICVCVVDQRTGEPRLTANQDIVRDGGFFAGSGSRHAFECWHANRDPHRCVESAKKADICSGGEVKYIDLNSGKHNLCYPTAEVSISDVRTAIEKRGHVMELTARNPNDPPFRKLTELAVIEPDLKELQGKLASGELMPEAPCDGMYNKWTAEEEAKLSELLLEAFSLDD